MNLRGFFHYLWGNDRVWEVLHYAVLNRFYYGLVITDVCGPMEGFLFLCLFFELEEGKGEFTVL